MARRLLVGAAAFVLGACIAPGDHKKETADSAWLADAQRQIAAREYRVSENGQGLQAPNRAHNLRTYFGPTGIRVHDRTAEGAPELLRLTLSGVGRGESVAAVVSGATPGTAENRVEIHRPGLVEWYVNSPDGLEQGFTLAERPNGDGPLALELAVEGARPALVGDAVVFDTGNRKLRYGELAGADANAVPLAAHFELAGAERLRIVVDDAGAAYPIAIDPLLTETADTQLESNQLDGQLGSSIAGAGDVNGDGYGDLIVGANRYDAGQVDEGAVFIFHGAASGIADGGPLTAETELQGNQPSAFLGSAVAAAGDVNGDGYSDIIVGADGYTAGQTSEGAAFVFLGSATGIADGDPAAAAAQFESDQAAAGLGLSVAGGGDVNGDGYVDVVVGAYLYDAGETNEGAAFVFLGSATGIPDGNPGTAATQLESDQATAQLGSRGALSTGDVDADGYTDVIVGAFGYDAGQTDEGAVFVFRGSASGVADGNPATADAQLESDQASAQLGTSAASVGDVNGDGYADVIAGAPFYDAGTTDEGAAFVFLGSASGIADGSPATAATQLESNQGTALFGISVGGGGDVNGDGYADVVAGARFYDAGDTNEGAAFVFLGGASGIADGSPASAFAQLERDQSDAEFGFRVADAGDLNGDGYADIVVGARLFDAGTAEEGAAFVYLGGGRGIANSNPSTLGVSQFQSNQVDAMLGSSVAGAGDVNGDGYSDVIVGSARGNSYGPIPTGGYDAGQSNEGAAFVLYGGPVGIQDATPATVLTQLESNQANALLGESVAGAGDVNGDGYSDVIVGAPQYDSGQTDEGAAFVFLGGNSGIASGNPASPNVAKLESDQAIALFGVSVASAGDVNGDGFGDVIVGAPAYDAGQSEEGAAFVFRGSASGIASGNPATPGVARLESDQANATLGFVASAGDVDGDGYGDVIVGAPNYTDGLSQSQEGAAFLFLGGVSGIANGNPATAAARFEADQANAQLGYVAGAGDVNGDGHADLIVGAPFYDNGQSNEGAAFLFLGSATPVANGTPPTAAARFESDQADARFGASAAGAGDVNGDGYADLIALAPGYDAGETDEGAAFVFLGSATPVANGTPATAVAQLESNQASAGYFANGFEGVAAGAGDVNGDGYADVIVGFGFYDEGESNEGSAFVFLGNANRNGRPVLTRQLRGNGSGIPVQSWGLSYSTTGFAAELHASHPQGTGRVKAQVQACPAGVAFGNGSCTALVTPSWVTVNGAAPEVVLSGTFSGLTNNKLYRWRARILHAPRTGATSANPAHGPWRRVGAQSVEGDIRLPEPGLRLSLAAGLGLIAALARRRRKV